MSSAHEIVNRMLGEAQRPFQVGDPRTWPELADLSPDEYEDYYTNLPIAYLKDGKRVGLDYQNNFIINTGGRKGVRFDDEVVMDAFLRQYEEQKDDVEVDRATHAYTWKGGSPNVPTYTLDQKRPHVVYEAGGYVFLKLPHDPTFIRREGIDMQHPVTGDTRIITDQGTVSIETLVGQKPKVLTRRAGTHQYRAGFWEEAEIKAFGHQPVFAVTLRRNGKIHVVRTTADHRWYAYKKARTNHQNKQYELRTHELQPGFTIPSVSIKPVLFASESPKGVRLSPVGVIAGFVFGDGSRMSEGNRPATAVLYGKKDAAMRRWFSKAHHAVPFTRSVGGTCVHDMPRFFKELPPLNECASYLLGWLAGYIAADGCVGAKGFLTLSSACRAHLECVETICQRYGIGVNGISTQMRQGYGKKSELHTLSFKMGFPKDILLQKSHRARWQPTKRTAEDWTVVSVEATGKSEPVFCAVVPRTGVFALEHNILTGNCLSVAHEDYCQRMERGEIEVYSQTEIATGKPVVDIEVALKKPSYNKPVKEPTVTQIRGPRNQLPPDDRHLPALMDFLTNYGGPKGWKITGHNVTNFDGRTDGDVVMDRWKELQKES